MIYASKVPSFHFKSSLSILIAQNNAGRQPDESITGRLLQSSIRFVRIPVREDEASCFGTERKFA